MTEHIHSFCDRCAGERRHEVVAQHKESWVAETNQPGFTVSGGIQAFILKCGGCEHVSFRHEIWDEFDVDPETGKIDSTIEIYPKKLSQRPAPVWFGSLANPRAGLESEIKHQLEQIYRSFDAQLFWLTLMGVRASIETLMIAKTQDHGSFRKNLSEFSKQGLISEPQRLALEKAIDEGGAAIHKGKQPDQQTALDAIQILENVLESVLVHPNRLNRPNS